MTKVAVAYIPVLHKGYLDFIAELEAEGVRELWLIGDDILESHDELDYINRKDRLRAVPVHMIQKTLETLTRMKFDVLDKDSIASLEAEVIVTPREDIGEVVVEHYFADKEVDYRSVFVRRDNHALRDKKAPVADQVVTADEFSKQIWSDVLAEAERSADWYRQVGAALVKDGEVVYVTHNEHMPEEQISNIEGDARTLFKRGIHINYVTSAHAEVAAIGTAAKEGIKTEGAELFVTDFPCPYCARLIAKAGIAKVYFLRGYAVLDGDDFLKDAGVEVVQVKLEE